MEDARVRVMLVLQRMRMQGDDISPSPTEDGVIRRRAELLLANIHGLQLETVHKW